MYEVHLGCWASVVIIIRVLRELGLRVKGYSYLNYELSVSRLRRLKRVYVLIKLIKYKLSRRRALMINTAQYRGIKHESQYRYLSEDYIEKYFNADYERYIM